MNKVIEIAALHQTAAVDLLEEAKDLEPTEVVILALRNGQYIIKYTEFDKLRLLGCLELLKVKLLQE